MTERSAKAVSARDVARAYGVAKLARELETDPGTVLIYRPPSFVLAALLDRLGVPPNAVTMAAGLINPAIVVATLTVVPQHALVVVTVLGVLYALLDCVDGDLARVSGQTSAIGHYCDFTFDVIHRFVFYGALGYLADRLVEPSILLSRMGTDYLGMMLVTAWIVVFTRLCREWALGEKDALDAQTASASPRRKPSLRALLWALFSSIDQHYAILGFLSWLFGVLDLYLAFLFAVTVVDVVISQFQIIRKLS